MVLPTIEEMEIPLLTEISKFKEGIFDGILINSMKQYFTDTDDSNEAVSWYKRFHYALHNLSLSHQLKHSNIPYRKTYWITRKGLARLKANNLAKINSNNP